ncbi:MAG: hypothetical protein WAO98_03415 [Alphaproteobacteria bacterium]
MAANDDREDRGLFDGDDRGRRDAQIQVTLTELLIPPFITSGYCAFIGSVTGVVTARSAENAIQGGASGLVIGAVIGVVAGGAALFVAAANGVESPARTAFALHSRAMGWGQNAVPVMVRTGAYGAVTGLLSTNLFKLYDLGSRYFATLQASQKASEAPADVAASTVVLDPLVLQRTAERANTAYQAALDAFSSHVIGGGKVGVAFGLAAALVCAKWANQLNDGVQRATGLTIKVTGFAALAGGLIGAAKFDAAEALQSSINGASYGLAAFVPLAIYNTWVRIRPPAAPRPPTAQPS